MPTSESFTSRRAPIRRRAARRAAAPAATQRASSRAAAATHTPGLVAVRTSQGRKISAPSIGRSLARVDRALSSSRAAGSLAPDQRAVLSHILSAGRQERATPKELLSAVETGIVESSLRNLPGGDADSAGWRQERASIYPNPTNLNASTHRYFRETASAGRGKGETAGQLAQSVQRSAYPDRYDEAGAQAKGLLRASQVKPNPADIRRLRKAGIAVKGGGARPTKGAARPQKTAAGKRYTNPFPSKAWQQSRTDQGVDFAPKTANAPIRAIGNATYVGKGEGPAWASGGGGGTGDGLLYKLHNSKGLPSPYIFVYEGIRADPHLKPGQTIKRGQIIGQGIQGGSLESGYADSSGTPISHSTYTEGMVTRGGTQFQNLLAKLPGSSATKGNIGSFVSSGGGGSAGASGFANITGVSVKQAQQMTPRQRLTALRAALNKTLREYGGSGSVGVGTAAPATASKLSRSHGSPVI